LGGPLHWEARFIETGLAGKSGAWSRQKGSESMFNVSPTSSAGELSAWRNIEH